MMDPKDDAGVVGVRGSDDGSDDEDYYEDEDEDEEEEEDVDDEETAPSHADHKSKGNELYKSKDYRGAIAHYTLAIESARSEIDIDPTRSESICPSLATYYGNRASALTMILKYTDAARDCDSALECDPTFSKAHFRKAKILIAMGDLDGAIRSYSLGVVRDPNDAKIVREKEGVDALRRRMDLAGEILGKIRGGGGGGGGGGGAESTRRRDAAQALRQVEIVLASCPAWDDATAAKVEALVWLGRYDDAYALTTKLIRRGMGRNSRLVLLRARCLFGRGHLDDAMRHLRQILAGDPDNREAMTMLKELRSLGRKKEEADAAYKSRRFEDCVPLYTEALGMCPRGSDAYRSKLHFNRASARANLRDHEAVVADCTSAIELDGGYLKAYMRRAASNLLIGDETNCEDALRDYDRALQLVRTEEQERDVKRRIRGARVQLKRSRRKDLYKILGVSRDATDAEIKRGYRKLALKWHPDRHSNSTEEEKKEAEGTFRDVNLAYEVLGDPQKKGRYDAGVDEQDLDNPHAQPGGGGGGMHGHGGGMGGIDPEVLFNMFMRQQGGGGGMGGMGGMGGGRGGGGGGPTFHFG